MPSQELGEQVPAFGGTHAPRPLPFDSAKRSGFSERLIRSHREDDYCGAVKALNAIERQVKPSKVQVGAR